MRSLCLLLLSAAAAVAQPIGFGLKGGLPLNDFLKAARDQNFRFDTTTNRYIIGPTVELRLPHGLGIELDVLYRHFGYSSFGSLPGVGSPVTDARTSGSAWEFPLVGKYKFGSGWVRPYVEAGVSWDHLSGLTQDIKTTIGGSSTSSSTSNPAELSDKSTRGFVMGAGLDVKAILIHVTPEIRFTRWGAKHFISGDLLKSNQNQAEFLIGFKF